MNKTKEITTYQEDVFSELVNKNSHKALRAERKAVEERKALGRVTKRVALFGLSAGIIFGLGQFGLMDWRLSAALTAVCGLTSMFNAGIYYGVTKGVKL